MNLPPQYAWLANEKDAPKALQIALPFLGLAEIPGPKNNPIIMSWANLLGYSWYENDETPWCGLFVSVCVKIAGFAPPAYRGLSALAWRDFGTVARQAMLGDILVFTREGGGHVGFYVGEDKDCYHVLGGNQGNKVCIARFPKTRVSAIRRCPWKAMQPVGVRVVHLAATGAISTNEA